MDATLRAHFSAVDRVMAGLIEAAGPYRLRPDRDCSPFQALARAIAHQQLHASAAEAIFGRFVNMFGDGSFPTPEKVLRIRDTKLRAIGFSMGKIAALKDLATKTIEGVVPDWRTLQRLDDEEIIARLTQVRGIGRWTVEMLLIFRLGRPDVLPVDDFGVRNGFRLAYGLRALPMPRALAAFGERWSPYRTAAAWYLWRAVELARAGRLPKPEVSTRLPRIRRKRRTVAVTRVRRQQRART